MRRILFTGLLIGVIAAGTPRMSPRPGATPCRQISRIPCDFIHCGGTGLDYVTLQCAGKGLTGRCEGNGGCRIGGK